MTTKTIDVNLKISNNISLKIMSFNMHGFKQGCPVLDDMIKKYTSDILFLQEHCLTPDNLYKFDRHFTGYFSFGCSAMSNRVETGMLRGRPFGGVTTLVSNHLRSNTKTVYCKSYTPVTNSTGAVR